MMRREECEIGKTFHGGGRQWRCTDIGTRIIAAVYPMRSV